MKTKDLITKEITAAFPKNADRGDKEYKAAEKRVLFLRRCVLYVETQPTKEFLKKQLNERIALLATIQTRFGAWSELNYQEGDTPSKQKARFNSVFEVKKIKDQIMYMRYILD